MIKEQQLIQKLYKQPLKSELSKVYDIPKAETYIPNQTTTIMSTDNLDKVMAIQQRA